LEALTGEFVMGEGEDAYIIRRDDGSLLLDGMLAIIDLKDCLQIGDLPEEGDYQTLNGLIMLLMGRMPATGDKLVVQQWQLEIVDMDGRRIDKVLAYKLPDEDQSG
jgi:putative hemolysin